MSAISLIGVLETEKRGNKREEKASDLLEDYFPETKARDLTLSLIIKTLSYL